MLDVLAERGNGRGVDVHDVRKRRLTRFAAREPRAHGFALLRDLLPDDHADVGRHLSRRCEHARSTALPASRSSANSWQVGIAGLAVALERAVITTAATRGSSSGLASEISRNRLGDDARERRGLVLGLEEPPRGEHLPEHDASGKTSARRSTDGRPTACSGAMYAILPLSWPARVADRRLAARATPKSVMRVMPSTPTRMFCGETSRCTSSSGLPCSSRSSCAAWRPEQRVDDDADGDVGRQPLAATSPRAPGGARACRPRCTPSPGSSRARSCRPRGWARRSGDGCPRRGAPRRGTSRRTPSRCARCGCSRLMATKRWKPPTPERRRETPSPCRRSRSRRRARSDRCDAGRRDRGRRASEPPPTQNLPTAPTAGPLAYDT